MNLDRIIDIDYLNKVKEQSLKDNSLLTQKLYIEDSELVHLRILEFLEFVELEKYTAKDFKGRYRANEDWLYRWIRDFIKEEIYLSVGTGTRRDIKRMLQRFFMQLDEFEKAMFIRGLLGILAERVMAEMTVLFDDIKFTGAERTESGDYNRTDFVYNDQNFDLKMRFGNWIRNYNLYTQETVEAMKEDRKIVEVFVDDEILRLLTSRQAIDFMILASFIASKIVSRSKQNLCKKTKYWKNEDGKLQLFYESVNNRKYRYGG